MGGTGRGGEGTLPTTSAFFSKMVNSMPGTLAGRRAPATMPAIPAPMTVTLRRRGSSAWRSTRETSGRTNFDLFCSSSASTRVSTVAAAAAVTTRVPSRSLKGSCCCSAADSMVGLRFSEQGSRVATVTAILTMPWVFGGGEVQYPSLGRATITPFLLLRTRHREWFKLGSSKTLGHNSYPDREQETAFKATANENYTEARPMDLRRPTCARGLGLLHLHQEVQVPAD